MLVAEDKQLAFFMWEDSKGYSCGDNIVRCGEYLYREDIYRDNICTRYMIYMLCEERWMVFCTEIRKRLSRVGMIRYGVNGPPAAADLL